MERHAAGIQLAIRRESTDAIQNMTLDAEQHEDLSRCLELHRPGRSRSYGRGAARTFEPATAATSIPCSIFKGAVAAHVVLARNGANRISDPRGSAFRRRNRLKFPLDARRHSTRLQLRIAQPRLLGETSSR